MLSLWQSEARARSRPRVSRGGTNGTRGTRPSLGLFLTEPARGLADLAGLWVAAPWLSLAPRGGRHGVLVLPGLLASDSSTVLLRWFLGWLGYDVRGWSLARNLGPTDQVLDASTSWTAVQAGLTVCNTTWKAQSGKLNTGRGNYWIHGTEAQTMFNTVVTPNSQQYPWGWCSSAAIGDAEFCKANSNHPGGVNGLMGDGSVKFLKDSINLQTYWALGTRARSEVISADAF